MKSMEFIEQFGKARRPAAGGFVQLAPESALFQSFEALPTAKTPPASGSFQAFKLEKASGASKHPPPLREYTPELPSTDPVAPHTMRHSRLDATYSERPIQRGVG